MLNHDHLFGPAPEPGRQIPPKQLANEFGEVSVRRVDNQWQVAAALAMGAFVVGDGENCHVGLALDASESMKGAFGRKKRISSEDAKQFIEQGLYKVVERDGVSEKVLAPEARKRALDMGLGKPTANCIREPAVRLLDNMIRTFATGGAESGTAEVVYWACGGEGKELEPLGTVGAAQLETLAVDGPQRQKFGKHTHLAPALRHFLGRTTGSGIFVFLTDGRIDDEDEVVKLTHGLARKMAAEEIYPPNIRCVLIGVGNQIDVEQFDRIDDMPMPEELEVYDIWNSKVFTDMRDISDAWSEIFDPQATIATRAAVYDDQGNVVAEWTDNVTALITFTMPARSKAFELEIKSDDPEAESLRIRQELA